MTINPSLPTSLVRADLATEAELLGALILWPERLPEARKHLRPEHLYARQSQDIMRAILRCAGDTSDVMAVLVAHASEEALPRASEIVADLILRAGEPDAVETMAEHLRREYRARETRAALADAVLALDMGEDVQVTLDALRSRTTAARK